MKTLNVNRTKVTLFPDSKRVLMRPFHFMSGRRASEICARIMALSEDEVRTQLVQLWAEFGGRHKNIREFFRRRFGSLVHVNSIHVQRVTAAAGIDGVKFQPEIVPT